MGHLYVVHVDLQCSGSEPWLDPRISTNSDAVLVAEGYNVATSERKKLSTTEYSLEIRQHPWNARACGFGPKDRRAIDSPPILQLKINDTSLTPEQIQKELRDKKYVANCFLYDDNGTQDVTLTVDEQQQSIQQLLGRTTSAHFYGATISHKVRYMSIGWVWRPIHRHLASQIKLRTHY
ncbi:velvet factor-domain-containing protein [Fusarium oxysporum f. sp. albedinis]|nr:velvet factor-domain-containing protein [Fusarium oxysporum f. sp. albedinis]